MTLSNATQCALASAGLVVPGASPNCASAGFPAWSPTSTTKTVAVVVSSLASSAEKLHQNGGHSLQVPVHFDAKARGQHSSTASKDLTAALGWAATQAAHLAAGKPRDGRCSEVTQLLLDEPVRVLACTAPTTAGIPSAVAQACEPSATCLSVSQVWMQAVTSADAGGLAAALPSTQVLVVADLPSLKYLPVALNGGRAPRAGFPARRLAPPTLLADDQSGNGTGNGTIPWTTADIANYQIFVWVWVLLAALVAGAFLAATVGLSAERDAILHSTFQAADFHPHRD